MDITIGRLSLKRPGLEMYRRNVPHSSQSSHSRPSIRPSIRPSLKFFSFMVVPVVPVVFLKNFCKQKKRQTAE